MPSENDDVPIGNCIVYFILYHLVMIVTSFYVRLISSLGTLNNTFLVFLLMILLMVCCEGIWVIYLLYNLYLLSVDHEGQFRQR